METKDKCLPGWIALDNLATYPHWSGRLALGGYWMMGQQDAAGRSLEDTTREVRSGGITHYSLEAKVTIYCIPFVALDAVEKLVVDRMAQGNSGGFVV